MKTNSKRPTSSGAKKGRASRQGLTDMQRVARRLAERRGRGDVLTGAKSILTNDQHMETRFDVWLYYMSVWLMDNPVDNPGFFGPTDPFGHERVQLHQALGQGGDVPGNTDVELGTLL